LDLVDGEGQGMAAGRCQELAVAAHGDAARSSGYDGGSEGDGLLEELRDIVGLQQEILQFDVGIKKFQVLVGTVTERRLWVHNHDTKERLEQPHRALPGSRALIRTADRCSPSAARQTPGTMPFRVDRKSPTL
jgi:hypothetical protein